MPRKYYQNPTPALLDNMYIGSRCRIGELPGTPGTWEAEKGPRVWSIWNTRLGMSAAVTTERLEKILEQAR
jgi:hypothetical protein